MYDRSGLSQIIQETTNQNCFYSEWDGRADTEGQNWEENQRPECGKAKTGA